MILRNHGRFPFEYWDKLTYHMLGALDRDPKEDRPAPGYRRMSATEAARFRMERRERVKADPWGVNGYHG